jgi:hypothetical protein
VRRSRGKSGNRLEAESRGKTGIGRTAEGMEGMGKKQREEMEWVRSKGNR